MIPRLSGTTWACFKTTVTVCRRREQSGLHAQVASETEESGGMAMASIVKTACSRACGVVLVEYIYIYIYIYAVQPQKLATAAFLNLKPIAPARLPSW